MLLSLFLILFFFLLLSLSLSFSRSLSLSLSLSLTLSYSLSFSLFLAFSCSLSCSVLLPFPPTPPPFSLSFFLCLFIFFLLSSFPPSMKKKVERLEDYSNVSICIFRSYWYIGVCVSIWACMCSHWKTDQRIDFFTHFTCFAICSAFTQPFSWNMWMQNREKWEDPKLVSNSTVDIGCPTSQADSLRRFHGGKRICGGKLH